MFGAGVRLRTYSMKPFRSSRISVFLALLGMAVAFYLVDCVVASLSGRHPELPMFERGIYAGGPFGSLATACVLLCAFGVLIFGKGE
jgi:hypothetical protein